MAEECDSLGIPRERLHASLVDKELNEFQSAKRIIVPSTFVANTFVSNGIPLDRISVIPYGVDLSLFGKNGAPPNDKFQILFCGTVGPRKGVSYLLDAYRQFQHPNKTLVFAGGVRPEMQRLIDRHPDRESIELLGHVPQRDLPDIMSRSHVMVLPSVEEGMALVQAQAMACGCPVIATTNTGSEDLFENRVEGYILPIRDVGGIVASLTSLADSPDLREDMSRKAVQKVRDIGGWDQYGERLVNVVSSLCGTPAL